MRLFFVMLLMLFLASLIVSVSFASVDVEAPQVEQSDQVVVDQCVNLSDLAVEATQECDSLKIILNEPLIQESAISTSVSCSMVLKPPLGKMRSIVCYTNEKAIEYLSAKSKDWTRILWRGSDGLKTEKII